ncbi:MAG: response regulator [Candidatus Omnitrophica bacterium]|nr:response regulator [Candidatus Omnitrophota bacterium]
MNSEGIVLIVDDDNRIITLLEEIITPMVEEKVVCASSGKEAKDIIAKNRLNLAILDYRLPDTDGIELMKLIKEKDEEIPVIIITGFGSIETGVEAIKKGAYDYILKPFHPEKIHALVRRLVSYREMEKENRSLRNELESKFFRTNSLKEHEKALIRKVLAECDNNIKKASKELGISPLVLNLKIRKLGLTRASK